MLERDILSRHIILSYSNHLPLQHGIYLGISGVQINAVMKLPLPCEWVFPITVRRIYLDMRERIAYA